MNTIWEVMLKAREEKIPQRRIRFRPLSNSSPYMEVAFTDLNKKKLDEEPIEVNAYRRFTEVFERLTDGEIQSGHPQLNDVLFDIAMHFMARHDLRAGLTRFEFHRLFLREELQAGKYGKRYRDILNYFSYADARIVESAMTILYHTGPSLHLIEAVFRKLYQYSVIYLDVRKQRELLIYIGKKKTPELEKQVDFLVNMFVPFDYVPHLFWDKHFGVIGVEQMMQIGEFVIY